MNTLMQLSSRARCISKYISSILLATFLSWTMGLPALLLHVYATTEVTTLVDSMSNSTVSTASNHTITFLSSTGGVGADGSTITYTFPSSFTGIGSLAVGDIDIATSTAASPSSFLEINSLAPNCGSTQKYAITFSSPTITVTVCSGKGGAIPPLSGFRLKVGTNAITSSPGSSQITNPSSSGQYDVAIAGTGGMVGNFSVYTLDAATTVSGIVAPILTFSVNSVISGAQVGVGSGTTTTTASTATTIPFGTVTVGTPKTIAQRLSVATNANNGFGVTLRETQALISTSQGVTTDIDDYSNGSGLGNTPSSDALTTWTAPTGTVTDENTWGHWGVTSSDNTMVSGTISTNDTTNPYLDATKYASIASTTATTGSPRIVAYHDGPSDGTTNHSGSTTVAYTVQITALQEAATDYTTSLIYVASPIF